MLSCICFDKHHYNRLGEIQLYKEEMKVGNSVILSGVTYEISEVFQFRLCWILRVELNEF